MAVYDFHDPAIPDVSLRREGAHEHGLDVEASDALREPSTLSTSGLQSPANARHGMNEAHASPGVIRVSSVPAQVVKWLWDYRLPLGKLVVLDGDPSLGKSTLTLDWAARVTTGTPWPDGSRCPTRGNVVLLSAEDGIADTIRPRLEARAAMLVAVDPEDEQRRIVAMTKSNLGPMPDALAYRIVTDELIGCGRIAWDGTTSHRAADLLFGPSPDDDGDDAHAVLADILDAGPQWVKDCLDAMASAGFSKDQAKRAKTKLGARSVKVGKPGDSVVGWKWELPLRAHEGSEESGVQNPAPLAPLALPSDHDRARDRCGEGLD